MIIKIVRSLFTNFCCNLKFFRSYPYSPKRKKLCGRRKGCVYSGSMEKDNMVRQFKKVFKHYWYVTLPIHVCNSTVWFGGCYLVTAEGFDILSELEELDVHSVLIDYLTHSSMGQFTVTYALFKFVSPFRYATTVIATKRFVQYLTRIGILSRVRKKKKKRFF